MSKSTVKPALTPTPRAKRSKRKVENAQFDAFVRRILRAYARGSAPVTSKPCTPSRPCRPKWTR